MISEPAVMVLSIGLKGRLLDMRSNILRAAGFHVVTARTTEDALTAIRLMKFRAVLLCNTLSSEDRAALMSLLKAQQPALPIVQIDSFHAESTALVMAVVKATGAQI